MKKLNISIYLFILLNISCHSQKVPDLPTIIIDTFGKEIPDEPKITAYMGIINNTTDNNYNYFSFCHSLIFSQAFFVSGYR